MVAKYVQGTWEAPTEINERRDHLLSTVVISAFKALLGTAEGRSVQASEIQGISVQAAEQVNAKLVSSMAGLSKASKLLQFVLEVLQDVLCCESATFFCIDPATKEMRAAGMTTTELGFQHLDFRLPSGKGITGYCAERNKAIRVPHPLTDPRFDASTDMIAGVTTTSIFCFPIKDSHGDAAGVFRFLNKLGVESFADVAFDVKDIAVLRAIGGSVVEIDGGEPLWEAELQQVQRQGIEKLEREIASLQEKVKSTEEALLARDANAVGYQESRVKDLQDEIKTLKQKIAASEGQLEVTRLCTSAPKRSRFSESSVVEAMRVNDHPIDSVEADSLITLTPYAPTMLGHEEAADRLELD